MSTTLTNGRILPQAGDKGNVWFPALENNIALDDAHVHDGITSNLLPPTAIDKNIITITDSSSEFAVEANGWYRTTVTIPDFSPVHKQQTLKFYLFSTGQEVGLYWEWVSPSQIIVESPTAQVNPASPDDLRLAIG